MIVHEVFSTKYRTPFLTIGVRPRLFASLATVGRDMSCEVFRVGAVEDHMHLAVDLARTVSVAEFVKRVKQASSVWMKRQPGVSPDFEWQAGYGAISLGQSSLKDC